MASNRHKNTEGHQARKRFGQNFLQDPNVIDNIVGSINPQPDDVLVEIGPGLGALTELMIAKVNKLQVIELDRDLIPRLNVKFGASGKLTIHQADALSFDYPSLLPGENKAKKQLRIVGNLPYNISTPLIFKLLENAKHIQDMHFMLQKEVVDRLCANVGEKAYGRLSIMVQYDCQAEGLFVVGPGAFSPPPKVDSAIVRLCPHKQTEKQTTTNRKLMGQIVTAAFNMRRKTIRNGLKDFASCEQLESVGINPGHRPETIALKYWIALTDLLNASSMTNDSLNGAE